ncbi:MAG: hypothetical protein GX573_02585, partial [Chloroflexi bacterium]|nr:hypothetical protein [Chloroflexota bacterium]
AKLRADVLEKGTDRPLPVAAELVFRVTAIHQDGTVALDHQVLSSAPGAGMGEVWSELVLDQAGVYSLSLELGWAHDNSFETLDTLTSQFEVRPIVNLQVMVLRPADDSSEEVWLLPNLLGKTPMTVQVEIRDENNNLVSLADLTGGAETRPTVILRQGDEQEDLTAQMVEVSPGMYQTEFEHKGRGSYEIQASVKTPDLALIGDYAWNPASVTAHHERDWATAMFVGGGVILLALALAVLGTVWSVVRWKQSKQYPLNTVLVLKIFDSQNPDQEVMATIPLAPFVVNRKKFGKGDLPAPWEKLVVSTHRDPMVSDEKMFYIDEVRIGGEPGNQTQGGGSPLIVGQDRVVHRTSMPGVMVDFIVGNNTDNVFSK